MTVAVYLPVAMAVLLALAARPLSHRLAPAAGARGLTVAAVVVAVSCFWTLALLVVSLVDDLPDTPLIGKLPVPDGVSLLAGGVLLWCAGRLAAALWRRRALRRGLAPVVASASGELVVVPDGGTHAFAVAGASGQPGHIVVSAGMLRALTAPQRRAMLAHERAHLDRRHPGLLTLAQFAAAANPLLVPVRDAVSFLCERHADELAADEVGDRVLVAEALAAAALAGKVRRVPAPAFNRLGVVDRVAALVAPYPRYRPAGLVTATAIAIVSLVAAFDATDQFLDLVQRALPF
jgi:Zn-dependent protease with chaperone function